MALGLGILRARDAADELWQRWLDASEESLRGHIALALGMAGVASHAAELRRSLETKELGSNLRLQLGRASGLLADSGAAPVLIDLLDHGDTVTDSSSAAQALARIGDARSIPPLLAIAKDPSRSPRPRGLAIGALGRMVEKTPLPWRIVFSVDMNYRALPPAVTEILRQF
jgi:HEAT repeat protein